MPCLIYHPLLQRSESRFLSFNAWLVDGKIQIESNLPLVTYSADSPHSYRIHSMVQKRFPLKSKTFYKINSSHSEIYYSFCAENATFKIFSISDVFFFLKISVALGYQQNKFSLEFLFSLKSPNLHYIRSVDIKQKSADL